MKKRTLAIAAFALSAIVAGCQDGYSSAHSGSTSVTVTKAPFSEQARILTFSDGCEDVLGGTDSKNEGVFALLATALIPIISETAVEYISSKLDEAAKGRTGSFAATAQVRSIDNVACLAVINGKFGDPLGETAVTNGQIKREALDVFDLADYPGMLFLASVTHTRPNVEVQPYYLHYGGTSAKSAGSGRKDISITVTLVAGSSLDKESKQPTKSETPQLQATFPFLWREVAIGEYLDGKALSSNSSKHALTIKDGATVSLSAAVTETEDPVLALKLFSENFKEKSPDLVKTGTQVMTEVIGVQKQNASGK
tara:strand:- start:1952 stop:2884 length:933 start_codon:yes stop_codon:yes gene_type:complete